MRRGKQFGGVGDDDDDDDGEEACVVVPETVARRLCNCRGGNGRGSVLSLRSFFTFFYFFFTFFLFFISFPHFSNKYVLWFFFSFPSRRGAAGGWLAGWLGQWGGPAEPGCVGSVQVGRVPSGRNGEHYIHRVGYDRQGMRRRIRHLGKPLCRLPTHIGYVRGRPHGIRARTTGRRRGRGGEKEEKPPHFAVGRGGRLKRSGLSERASANSPTNLAAKRINCEDGRDQTAVVAHARVGSERASGRKPRLVYCSAALVDRRWSGLDGGDGAGGADWGGWHRGGSPQAGVAD